MKELIFHLIGKDFKPVIDIKQRLVEGFYPDYVVWRDKTYVYVHGHGNEFYYKLASGWVLPWDGE